jgi:hypothetical protein
MIAERQVLTATSMAADTTVDERVASSKKSDSKHRFRGAENGLD